MDPKENALSLIPFIYLLGLHFTLHSITLPDVQEMTCAVSEVFLVRCLFGF